MGFHRIIPRAEWGARYDNGAGAAPLPAKELWLHHSVTIAPDLLPPFDDDYAAIRTLERIGESRFGRGISYTFPITPAGLIFEGHGVDRIGSHTAARNSIARAICLVGNYEIMHPTEAQLEEGSWLMAHGFLSGWWDAVPLDGGHRDLKATACPGRYAYAAIAEFNRRAKAHLQAAIDMAGGGVVLPAPTPPPPAPAPAPAPVPAPSPERINVEVRIVRLGSQGGDVRTVQSLLNAKAGQRLGVDGDFGSMTDAAVKNWQKFFGLAVDGIVGQATWGTLVNL